MLAWDVALRGLTGRPIGVGPTVGGLRPRSAAGRASAARNHVSSALCGDPGRVVGDSRVTAPGVGPAVHGEEAFVQERVFLLH